MKNYDYKTVLAMMGYNNNIEEYSFDEIKNLFEDLEMMKDSIELISNLIWNLDVVIEKYRGEKLDSELDKIIFGNLKGEKKEE